ncbi:phage exclusion protein Lit family protein [Mariniphaga sp.]|uniref:phage exclusion protein Lit family protein n=1 Tax=Mariniphaga sp. TaxID=1954475 RepID=UPI00356780F2
MEHDYSEMYSKQDLSYWQTRYPANISWNFNDLMLGKLYPKEKYNAFGTKLEFPLTPYGEMAGSPFSFYAAVPHKTIYIPISSVKFIDDLAIASAWLEQNGYSQETVMDYISVLKYSFNRFPKGNIPGPLKALHIPDNALDDRLVDDLSQKILKSIIVWILGHELGHIVYNHPAYHSVSFAESQKCEKEADAFATDMFRRIGTIPAGMILLFTVFTTFYAHRGDFSNEKDWQNYLKNSTHPVSLERLKLISKKLVNTAESFTGAEPDRFNATRVTEYVGREAGKIVDIINSEKMQEFLRLRAMAVDIHSLYPRKIGDVAVAEQGFSENYFTDEPFSGIYKGERTRQYGQGKEEIFETILIFYRNGNKVTGRFGFGLGTGILNGLVKENKLVFNWKWANEEGVGEMVAADRNSFSGKWQYNEGVAGGGSWKGVKLGQRIEHL